MWSSSAASKFVLYALLHTFIVTSDYLSYWFQVNLYKPLSLLFRNIPAVQHFLKHSDQPVRQQPQCHLKSHLNQLPFPFFLTSAGHLDNIYKPKYIELLPCD